MDKKHIHLHYFASYFFIIGYLAWRNGRTYCNTICPVGTLLGFLSEYSLFKPVFDQEKCNKCGLCARNCKAACIDAKNQQIDYSRCVSCMNCLEKCNKEAMIYSCRRVKVKEERTREDDSRRRFLSVTSVMALTTVAARAQQLHVDGGFADIEDKKHPIGKRILYRPEEWGSPILPVTVRPASCVYLFVRTRYYAHQRLSGE